MPRPNPCRPRASLHASHITHNLAPGQDVETTLPAPRPSGDFGIVGMRFRVVDEHGNTLSAMDGIHLHHIVMLNQSKRDQLCTGRAERFGGSGMEQTPIDIPEPYAYMVRSGDQWAALFHLMNSSGGGGHHGSTEMGSAWHDLGVG